MRYKILINLLILTGLSAYTAQAQEGWTLRRCIDYAIEHNINVQQTANSAEQSKVEVNTAKWARKYSVIHRSGITEPVCTYQTKPESSNRRPE